VESLEPTVVVSHISRKTSEMWGTRDLLRGCENKRKRPQISPLRYAPVEMTILFEGGIRVSTKSPRNCRSLGFARDDKGEGCGRGGYRFQGRWWMDLKGLFHHIGWAARSMTTPAKMTILFEGRSCGSAGPRLCHLDRSAAQRRDLCVEASSWKCFSTERSGEPAPACRGICGLFLGFSHTNVSWATFQTA
jgi:hypothetical protein